MRKLPLFAVGLALVLVAPAFAADVSPPLDIPVYPGAKVTNEVYLTNADLLPMIKQTLAVLGNGNPGPVPDVLSMLNKLDFTTLNEAIKDLQAVKGSFYNVSGIRDATRITDFYSEQLRDDHWTRTLLMSPDDTTSITVYSQGAQALFGVMAKADGNVIHVTAFRTRGMVDLPKLVTWGRSAAGLYMGQMDPAHSGSPLAIEHHAPALPAARTVVAAPSITLHPVRVKVRAAGR